MTDNESANIMIMRTAPYRNIRPYGLLYSEKCVGYMLNIARQQEQDKISSERPDIHYQVIIELANGKKHVTETCDNLEKAQKRLMTARTDHPKAKAFYITEVSERIVQSVITEYVKGLKPFVRCGVD